MRLIDADALEKEGWSLHRTIRVDKHTAEYQTKPIKQVPTIEPRCEVCEAFNKTRLLIPQPQRTGRWLPDNNSVYEMRFICSECKRSQVVPTIGFIKYKPIWDFCPNCGADMREEQE